jgi:hypothetical protein
VHTTEEDTMSATHVPDRHEDRPDTDEDGRRLLFDLRPTPRRRADLMGVNRVLWAALWTVVVILALFPVPWWWFW